MSDQLSELPNVPRGQNYVCLSFLVNKDGDTSSTTGIRVGGVFDTYQEACDQAKKIQQFDDRHHVFVGETGKWLPYNPDPNSEAVKDSEYANEQLNALMKGHKENMEKARLFHELRKTEKMMDNINENLEERNKTREELTKKLSKVKNVDEAQTITKSLESIEEQIKRMESRLEDCKNNDTNLKSELTELEKNSTTRDVQTPLVPPQSGEGEQ